MSDCSGLGCPTLVSYLLFALEHPTGPDLGTPGSGPPGLDRWAWVLDPPRPPLPETRWSLHRSKVAGGYWGAWHSCDTPLYSSFIPNRVHDLIFIITPYVYMPLLHCYKKIINLKKIYKTQKNAFISMKNGKKKHKTQKYILPIIILLCSYE